MKIVFNHVYLLPSQEINDSLFCSFLDSILVAIFTALLRPCRSVSSIKDGYYSVEVNLPECRPRVRRRCRNRAVSTLESVANRARPKPTACRSRSLSLSPLSSRILSHSWGRVALGCGFLRHWDRYPGRPNSKQPVGQDGVGGGAA